VLSLVLPPLALGGHDGESTIWVTNVHGAIDSAWVVSVPGGSSDYFSSRYAVLPGTGNAEDVVDGLPITGIALSVADFGSTAKFPMVGVFYPNLAVDPSGITPDLSRPISNVTSPSISAPNPLDFVPIDLPEAPIASGTTSVNTVVQLPVGDPGLLAVGSDSTTSSNGGSCFTQDGFATAFVVSFLDWGMNPGQDNSSTTSCKPADRSPNGRLRVSGLPATEVGAGDHLTTTVSAGSPVVLSFFGTHGGDQFRIVTSTASCTRSEINGPVFTALADGDGDGSYHRVTADWPYGYGGSTMQFSVLWGNNACATPTVGFTNCVTVIAQADNVFGICDDGTIESGWVVGIPSSSSDYFNNDFGSPPASVNNVLGLCISVLDFVTALPAFPSAGISDANLVLDPSGHTPDVSGPGLLCLFAPFTFPSGSFETTANQYTCHTCPTPVPASSFASHAHGWMQFPAGDSGLLGIGADSSSPPRGCSFSTSDGYTTPAVPFFANLGIRVTTN
jgi:hypothetical protein